MTGSLRRAALVLALLLPGAAALAAPPPVFQPPPLTKLPPGPFGQEVKLGEEIFRHTHRFTGRYVGADLRCSNCHLDGGRLAGAAPLWAAWVAFPTYRSKTKAVNTFGQRMHG